MSCLLVYRNILYTHHTHTNMSIKKIHTYPRHHYALVIVQSVFFSCPLSILSLLKHPFHSASDWITPLCWYPPSTQHSSQTSGQKKKNSKLKHLSSNNNACWEIWGFLSSKYEIMELLLLCQERRASHINLHLHLGKIHLHFSLSASL